MALSLIARLVVTNSSSRFYRFHLSSGGVGRRVLFGHRSRIVSSSLSSITTYHNSSLFLSTKSLPSSLRQLSSSSSATYGDNFEKATIESTSFDDHNEDYLNSSLASFPSPFPSPNRLYDDDNNSVIHSSRDSSSLSTDYLKLKSSIGHHRFISSNEIVDRQRKLLHLISESLRNQALKKTILKQPLPPASSTSISPLVLIVSSPFQNQPNTSIPISDCKQNTDFTYFTGLHSGSSDQLTSDCVLALFYENPEQGSDSSIRSVIFAPVRTRSDQIWHGPDFQMMYDDVLDSICDEVRPLSNLVEFVTGLIGPQRQNVYVSRNGLEYRSELVTHLKYFMKFLPSSEIGSPSKIPSIMVRDGSAFIDQLRVIKSPTEIAALERIASIGSQALANTMNWTRRMALKECDTFGNDCFETIASGNLFEAHVAAKFEFETRLLGAKRLSFPSVCASNFRSTIIHYGRNDRPIDSRSDWILTDVGCEDADGYCCDISRTWPVNNILTETASLLTVSNIQLRLQMYEALVSVQRALIRSIVVGQTSLDQLHQMMISLLGQLLISFDVFESSVSKSDVASLTKRICPHHVSHYIGLDIHDTPSISRSQPLKPGMCFSVEPGLYFPLEGLPIRSQFRGIGLRIEDDILIDPKRPDGEMVVNLTELCPMI